MNTTTIKKIFGGIQIAPAYILADWSIGPSRASGLAEYAIATLNESALPLRNAVTNHATLQSLEDKLRDAAGMLEREILLWEDEQLGPKDEQGQPLSTIGTGAKAAYKNFIGVWVQKILTGIEAELHMLPSVESLDPEFLTQATAMVKEYPTVIQPLREVFIRQAGGEVALRGVGGALSSLRSQLESVRRAGELKYG